MGKPFTEELKKNNDTYKWALTVPIANFEEIISSLTEKPLFVVGSGGSSSACSLLVMHHQEFGVMASNITPLELQYSKKALNKNSNVVFISASGKNSDILLAFDTAIALEPSSILSICLKEKSLLASRSSKFSISKIIEFENIAGKDGFLATNSLIAYFTIISRLYGYSLIIPKLFPDNNFLDRINQFSQSLYEDFSIIVLFAGWGKPVALDLESKFSESGIGNILLSDYRNFGHGRHNWLDKKKKQSAIVALVSKDEKELATKTLDFLPKDIPKMIIESEYSKANASLDLLYKSFFLVDAIGKIKGIDPGRPGVPEYGSKLYNLKYSKLYNKKSLTPEKLKNAISRKQLNTRFSGDENGFFLWKNAYKNFIDKINNTEFRGLFLDYDGTLCSADERFVPPRNEIIERLNFFLSKNILIGIVTGRGKSVRLELQKFIDRKHWNNVIIGYYNGAQMSTLDINSMPLTENIDNLFDKIETALLSEPLISEYINIEVRLGQITVVVKDRKQSKAVKAILSDFLYNKFKFKIQILESSHSVDIISAETSKNSIFEYCREHFGQDHNYLCIGDRGKYPGNDFQLLSTEYSLSVDQVSNDPYSCWNLAATGTNCVEATLEYFDAIIPTEISNFKIKL